MRLINRFAAIAAVASLAGCAAFPGGGTPADTFSLTRPPTFEGLPSSPRRQVLVAEPVALKQFDGENIVIRTSPTTIQYLANSQWSDRLPNIVQAQLVEAFENTDRLGGVSSPGEGLAIDYQVLTTIRNFEVVVYGQPVARVELSVKLLNDRNGVVIAQQVFEGTAPVPAGGNDAYVQALDAAFDQAVSALVPWSLSAF